MAALSPAAVMSPEVALFGPIVMRDLSPQFVPKRKLFDAPGRALVLIGSFYRCEKQRQLAGPRSPSSARVHKKELAEEATENGRLQAGHCLISFVIRDMSFS
jgi:hypothetical protein